MSSKTTLTHSAECWYWGEILQPIRGNLQCTNTFDKERDQLLETKKCTNVYSCNYNLNVFVSLSLQLFQNLLLSRNVLAICSAICFSRFACSTVGLCIVNSLYSVNDLAISQVVVLTMTSAMRDKEHRLPTQHKLRRLSEYRVVPALHLIDRWVWWMSSCSVLPEKIK